MSKPEFTSKATCYQFNIYDCFDKIIRVKQLKFKSIELMV